MKTQLQFCSKIKIKVEFKMGKYAIKYEYLVSAILCNYADTLKIYITHDCIPIFV